MLSRRLILLTAVVAAIAAIITQPHAKSDPAPQNVVLILTDDQTWDGLQYMPNVESQLVAHGVTFSNAFDNNPLCCPTRTTIMTGLTSGHNGVWTNGPGKVYTPPGDGGFQGFLDHGDQTRQVFGWLHAAGYQTALIGKFLNGYNGGTGAQSDIPYVLPGVDNWKAMVLEKLATTKTGCQSGGYNGTCYSNNGKLFGPDSEYSTTRIGDWATSFIQNADPNKPLFLYMAPRAPHNPTVPEPKYANACGQVPPIASPDFNKVSSGAPAYMAAMPLLSARKIAQSQTHWVNFCRTLLTVDDQVARVVQALQDTGRLGNTLIVFASDNGFMFGQHRWTGKLVPYEQSIRVPVIVRDDAVIPANLRGTTESTDITSLDYTPTFLEAAQLPKPGLDGESLFPLFNGNPAGWLDQSVVLIEHGNGVSDTGEKAPSYCGVRTPAFLYAQYSTGEEELYDLSADAFELKNVAGDPAYAPQLDQLRADTHALCNPTPPSFTFTH